MLAIIPAAVVAGIALKYADNAVLAFLHDAHTGLHCRPAGVGAIWLFKSKKDRSSPNIGTIF